MYTLCTLRCKFSIYNLDRCSLLFSLQLSPSLLMCLHLSNFSKRVPSESHSKPICPCQRSQSFSYISSSISLFVILPLFCYKQLTFLPLFCDNLRFIVVMIKEGGQRPPTYIAEMKKEIKKAYHQCRSQPLPLAYLCTHLGVGCTYRHHACP